MRQGKFLVRESLPGGVVQSSDVSLGISISERARRGRSMMALRQSRDHCTLSLLQMCSRRAVRLSPTKLLYPPSVPTHLSDQIPSSCLTAFTECSTIPLPDSGVITSLSCPFP